MSPQPATRLPRSVWLLGWVSLATDAASESIYSLLPFFLTQVLGASAVSLGVVEGAAEAANSLLKIMSGRLADRSRVKRPLVLAGYAVSSAVRPLIAAVTGWGQVLAVRVADRVGKGVRGAPRDAMLAGLATPANRGQVFGFHRAMDNLGAVIGPLAAALFLFAYPGRYRTLFALTIVPGALAVALIFLIREDGAPGGRSPASSTGAGPHGSGAVQSTNPAPARAEPLPPGFRRFMLVLALFTIGNSSDAFLLLRLTEVSGSPASVPLMWAGLNAVRSGVSLVAGSWSDRVGRRTVIGAGWLVYAAVYVGFAASSSLVALLVWFGVYGVYFGFAEGTERALVADLAPSARRGFAYGLYNAVTGLGALAASVIFGAVWTVYGTAAAFGVGASLALAATVLLFAVI